MKATILKVYVLILTAVLVTSCSDDDSGANFTEENFLEDYLDQSGFVQKEVVFINSGDYEFGLDFTPKVKGKITALKVMLPAANPSLRITVWNKAAGTIYRTETVNVANADTAFVFDISDLELIKDNEYTITMNSNDWYDRRRTDSGAATYPFVIGNIQINRYRWAGGSAQTYPANVSSNYYAGDLSFTFLQTE